MQKVKTILNVEISQGKISWPKLEKMLGTYLEAVGHNASAIGPTGKPVKLEDAVQFNVKGDVINGSQNKLCYKLYEVRLNGKDGQIYASGLQKGFYDGNNIPRFPFEKVKF